MRIHVLKHEPEEFVGSMHSWFKAKNYAISTTEVYAGETLPSPDSFDWLVIMGGTMGAYEEDKFDWIAREKELIRNAIAADKKVLGLCLGGQMIASAMGGEVRKASQQEIGWHRVEKTNDVATWMPQTFHPLNWHGDYIIPPANATCFATGSFTQTQGFCLGEKVWGLQFHLEAEPNTVDLFHSVGGSEPLLEGDYVQSLEYMRANNKAEESIVVMHALLDMLDKV